MIQPIPASRRFVVITWLFLGVQATFIVWLLYFEVRKSYDGQITRNTASVDS